MLFLILIITTFSGSISRTIILSCVSKITSPCLSCVPCGRIRAISVPLSEVFLILTRRDSNLVILIVSQSSLLHIPSYFCLSVSSFLIFPIILSIVINSYFLSPFFRSRHLYFACLFYCFDHIG